VKLGATTAIAVAGVTGVALAVARQYRTVAPAPRELRTWQVWIPLSITGPLTLRLARRLFGPTVPVDGVDVVEHPDGGTQGVYVYRPVGSPAEGLPALLWIHGGGTILGTPEEDHELCSQLAEAAGIVVVSARYRLAPEHPFPAAHDDCYAALTWTRAHATEIGVDPERIAVGGASAGGGLAAGVVQRAVDDGVPVAFQLLVYPMLDDRTTLRPASGRDHLIWSRASNRYAWTAYLGRSPAPGDAPEYAVPARRTDLAGLPPTWVGVGDLDLFLDEDVDYARRLEAAGVPVELVVVPDMYHAADVDLHATVPSMTRFRQQLHAAVASTLGMQQSAVTPGLDRGPGEAI